MSSQYWNDQTFWATPIVYDAMDEFHLDVSVRVRFVDCLPGRVAEACYSETRGKGVIRFSKWSWTRMSAEERRETLQHEAAHIVKAAQLEAKEEIYNRRLEQDRKMEERQRGLKDQLDKAREIEQRHQLEIDRLGHRETELGEEQERLTARRRQLDL